MNAWLIPDSQLTCPGCGGQWRERMPIDRFQLVSHCPGCGCGLRAAVDGCCVYCTHGSVPCPLTQAIQRCAELPPLIPVAG